MEWQQIASRRQSSTIGAWEAGAYDERKDAYAGRVSSAVSENVPIASYSGIG